MKSRISVLTVDELEELAAEVIEIYEAPPEGANPEDEDDPHLGENGILFVETNELEVEADFPLDDFPEEATFSVIFIGWDETEERMAEAHGLETHLPAEVKITLKKKWLSDSGKSMAIYGVSAEHGA